ncbi:nucleoid occlusion factor SlmA [Desulfosporosinus acididurans]|uniref:Nucleoid occlusion factor SlmA n=1 Tax=Desulfosporosinus acididurans TaxID=476652 RepID=A0A0J1FM64_9FIRM|nr:TetR/AcrR family transcriptional regulator [Desulfosporosinus acididurans]KLU64462.1 nucleoid occlusion factor SlmA [Desulfosporosinus acididurans]
MTEKKNDSSGEIENAQPNNSGFSNSKKQLRADAKQNREQILQTAHKIFAEKGLAVPISEIASKAGIGIGTVYRHFPTKEVLFNEVIISYKQKLTKKAKSLSIHTDPGKAFFDFISLIMEDGFTNKAMRDAFRIGIFRVRTATSGVLLDFQSSLADLLTRAQDAKAVREDIEAIDLIALMSGLLMVVDEYEDTPDRSRFNQLLSIVCDGLHYNKTRSSF